MKKAFAFLIVGSGMIAYAGLIGIMAYAQMNATSTDSSSSLKALAPELRGKTQIPLRFPTFLPDTGGQQIFAVLRDADASEYDILLATKLPCAGGNACSYGSVQGSKSPLDPIEGKPIAVSLGKGILGQFTAAQCHAFCSEAYVRWKENGVYYSIGVKAGKKDALIEAAKSTLGPQLKQ